MKVKKSKNLLIFFFSNIKSISCVISGEDGSVLRFRQHGGRQPERLPALPAEGDLLPAPETIPAPALPQRSHQVCVQGFICVCECVFIKLCVFECIFSRPSSVSPLRFLLTTSNFGALKWQKKTNIKLYR